MTGRLGVRVCAICVDTDGQIYRPIGSPGEPPRRADAIVSLATHS